MDNVQKERVIKLKITKCYFCHGGPVIKQKSDHISKVGGQLVEIKNVPCEICQQCGEKYFNPKTVRRLEQIVKVKAKEYIHLPVYSYA